MNDCKRIRILIDEAERPGVFSYETEDHTSRCAACSKFAEERTSLREILAGTARICVPANYDVMLRSKLDEARSVKTFSWLSPIGYMQMGAATAGIIIVIVAAQYGGLFSNVEKTQSNLSSNNLTAPNPNVKPDADAKVEPPVITPDNPPVIASSVSRKNRVIAVSASESARARDVVEVDPSFVILMGRDGETRVSVPTVGVGAQPILMSNSRPVASAVHTSF